MTPLMLAASRNNSSVCSILLSSGADPLLLALDGRDALAIARAKGSQSVIDLLTPFYHSDDEAAVLPFKDQHSGYHTETALLDDDEIPFDFSLWETIDDAIAPLDDAPLAEAIRKVNETLSTHTAVDSSEDWGGLQISLPKFATPLFNATKEEEQPALEQLLRRGLREGSVPERSILLAITGNADGVLQGFDESQSNLSIVLEELGAEIDQRIELECEGSEWEANDKDEDIVTEGLILFEDMERNRSARTDQMQFYANVIDHNSLLAAEDERLIGMRMEEGVSLAVDALALWRSGLENFVSAAKQVQLGNLNLGSVCRGMPRSDDDSGDLSSVENSEEVEIDLEDDDFVFSSSEFLQQAELVNKIVSLRGGVESNFQILREALLEARLSPAFLISLGKIANSDGDVTAKSFIKALRKLVTARDRMVLSNLRLAKSVATRYQGRGLDIEDLVQEGIIGLIKAVDRYSWRKGFRFSTYATHWIRQQVSRSLADYGKTIRLPVHVHETTYKISMAIKAIELEAVRAAASGDFAARLSLERLWSNSFFDMEVIRGATAALEIPESNIEKIVALMARMNEPVSLYEPSDICLAPVDWLVDSSEYSDPECCADKIELSGCIKLILSSLTEREAQIIRMRFGIDFDSEQTLEEVGRQFNVTRERIRQIEGKALRKLAHPTRSRILGDFIDYSLSVAIREVEVDFN
jgi:RNA polymerase primary sigma factor